MPTTRRRHARLGNSPLANPETPALRLRQQSLGFFRRQLLQRITRLTHQGRADGFLHVCLLPDPQVTLLVLAVRLEVTDIDGERPERGDLVVHVRGRAVRAVHPTVERSRRLPSAGRVRTRHDA